MSRYIPEGNVDPNTFASVMESANAKYLLAKVTHPNGYII